MMGPLKDIINIDIIEIMNMFQLTGSWLFVMEH